MLEASDILPKLQSLEGVKAERLQLAKLLLLLAVLGIDQLGSDEVCLCKSGSAEDGRVMQPSHFHRAHGQSWRSRARWLHARMPVL